MNARDFKWNDWLLAGCVGVTLILGGGCDGCQSPQSPATSPSPAPVKAPPLPAHPPLHEAQAARAIKPFNEGRVPADAVQARAAMTLAELEGERLPKGLGAVWMTVQAAPKAERDSIWARGLSDAEFHGHWQPALCPKNPQIVRQLARLDAFARYSLITEDCALGESDLGIELEVAGATDPLAWLSARAAESWLTADGVPLFPAERLLLRALALSKSPADKPVAP